MSQMLSPLDAWLAALFQVVIVGDHKQLPPTVMSREVRLAWLGMGWLPVTEQGKGQRLASFAECNAMQCWAQENTGFDTMRLQAIKLGLRLSLFERLMNAQVSRAHTYKAAFKLLGNLHSTGWPRQLVVCPACLIVKA